MVGVALLLVATTIPLGTELWFDFLEASTRNTDVILQYKEYKLITVQGFLVGLFGRTELASAAWAAAAVMLLIAAAIHWRTPDAPFRHIATVVLLAIATNPYMSFYDALLLVLPATVWWCDRKRWRQSRWLFVGALIGIAWIWEHLAHSWSPAFALAGWEITLPFSLIGPIAAVWLLVAAGQSRRRLVPRPTSDRADGP
jgi:hypothetical protein